jgi:hypothetical protein
MNNGEKHGHLVDLIVDTWNEAELRAVAKRMSLAGSIPGGGVSITHLADEFVDLLRRRGNADRAFFERLAQDSADGTRVVAVAALWGVQLPQLAAEPAPPLAVATAPSVPVTPPAAPPPPSPTPASAPRTTTPLIRVLVSYAHESEVHRQRVLDLANQLRRDGIESWIDRYVPPPAEGWSRWMDEQLEKADRVIVVCSEKYFERTTGTAPAGEGLGVSWEWHRIRSEFYSSRGRGARFVPVWFDAAGAGKLPSEAWDRPRYDVGDLSGEGYRGLLRDLRRESEVVVPPVAGRPA